MHADLHIAADHPAYQGHFPGVPIFPGALLLDEALHEIACGCRLDLTQWQISSLKFSQVVSPGDALRIEHWAGPERIRFEIRNLRGLVAAGTLTHGH